MLKGRIAIERFAICLIGLSVALTQAGPGCFFRTADGRRQRRPFGFLTTKKN